MKGGPGFVGPVYVSHYFLLSPDVSGFGIEGVGELGLLQSRSPGITHPTAECRGYSVMGISQEHMDGKNQGLLKASAS